MEATRFADDADRPCRRRAIDLRALVVTACGALASLFAAGAPAQDAAQGYPNRMVRVIVPSTPGGGADIIARIFSQPLGKALGQNFVVDNRPGAANIIGTELVAKAPPDGYTLLLGTTGPLANNPLLYAKLPYDALKDFAPISNVANSAFVLVVHPSLPVKSVKELVALAKARPGQLSYASWGHGSSTHLATVLLMTMTSIDIVHVPYKGSGNTMPDMLAGNVQLAFDSMLSSVPHIGGGRLRPLGVSALKRSAVLPEVADAYRGRPRGLRGRFLVRLSRAGKNAARNRRQAARRNHQGAQAAGGAGAHGQSRCRADRQYAGPVRRADPARSREVGQGRAGRRHPTGVAASSPSITCVNGVQQ